MSQNFHNSQNINILLTFTLNLCNGNGMQGKVYNPD